VEVSFWALLVSGAQKLTTTIHIHDGIQHLLWIRCVVL
jgi:hypothetical protein